MPNARIISGITRGPDFDREPYEIRHVEAVVNKSRNDRRGEFNEPLVRAAVSAGKEVADNLGRSVDVTYDSQHDVIVMRVMDAAGEELIREIPPEETIRMAQRLKENRSRYVDSTF